MIPAPRKTVRRPWVAFVALTVFAGLFAAGWVVSAYTAERYGITFSNRTTQNLTVVWTLRDLEGHRLQRAFALGAGGTYRDEYVTGAPGTYLLEVNAGPQLDSTREVRFGESCHPSVTIRPMRVDIRQCVT